MARKSSKKVDALKRLKVLVAVVNNRRTEYFLDIIEDQEINMQMVVRGQGTTDSRVLEVFGLDEKTKSLLVGLVREDKEKKILDILEDKFKQVKNGKGIAFTIPIDSLIGVSIYQFLSNQR